MNRLSRILKRGNTPVLVLAIATGALVALVVAGFEVITDRVLLDRLGERPLWQIALAPAVGLSAAALILRVLGRGTASATSDEFVRAFHQRTPRLPLRELPAKLLAGVATIGLGGALGSRGSVDLRRLGYRPRRLRALPPMVAARRRTGPPHRRSGGRGSRGF